LQISAGSARRRGFHQRGLVLLADDVHAQLDAFIADEHGRPAISLRTSCWLLPQNEQYRVFLNRPKVFVAIVFLCGPTFREIRAAHLSD
jgi:hypothetical protein